MTSSRISLASQMPVFCQCQKFHQFQAQLDHSSESDPKVALHLVSTLVSASVSLVMGATLPLAKSVPAQAALVRSVFYVLPLIHLHRS